MVVVSVKVVCSKVVLSPCSCPWLGEDVVSVKAVSFQRWFSVSVRFPHG